MTSNLQIIFLLNENLHFGIINHGIFIVVLPSFDDLLIKFEIDFTLLYHKLIIDLYFIGKNIEINILLNNQQIN